MSPFVRLLPVFRMTQIARTIALELGVRDAQVLATIALLDEGATVPFIARYRKEVTGGLDDTQLRTLDERLRYLREMEERRDVILKSITEQGKLTPELEAQIRAADTKTGLEDLYLPYKPKRRTKAQIAREAGLQPLAEGLLADPTQAPEALAAGFVDAEKGVADVKAALDGAKHILMEQFGEDAALLGKLRQFLTDNAQLCSKMAEGKETEGAKFRDYFEHREPLKNTPSHRALAIFRGRNEGMLTVSLQLDGEEAMTRHPCETMIAEHTGIRDKGRAADHWLQEVVRWTWKVKLLSHLEAELLADLRERAEEEAIKVFARNLNDLLMAAPAGQRTTLGLDPGLRTGVKVALVDATGQMLHHGTIFPHAPRNDWDGSLKVLAAVCKQFNVDLISIGNGTASRETDKLVTELLKKHPDIKAQKVMVSEAGASVYSASEFAAREFPDLDVSFRGAVSIARRLQDPLAELVKIDPKSIGVGQYQHDVSQTRLARSLDAVVEDCVNAVGVDVNTASEPLLARISGLNKTIAGNIVAFRNKNGAFKTRDDLRQVPRLGDKTFEQSAGFLRVMTSANPLDRSAVHPEAYPLVETIARASSKELRTVVGDTSFLRSIKPAQFVTEKFGVPTITDILRELEKPGRDPRPEFKTAQFQEGVETLADLKPGMVLEGCVTNVTNFGAFVDIGVHQDGLVHISVLSDKFVKDAHEVVKAGDIVKVKVVEVDIPRKRIALSMRMDTETGEVIGKGQRPGSALPPRGGQGAGQGGRPAQGQGPNGRPGQGQGGRQESGRSQGPQAPAATLADMFAKAKQLKK
jgi:uncharacterized protein